MEKKIFDKKEFRCILASIVFAILGGIMFIMVDKREEGATGAQSNYTDYVFTYSQAKAYVTEKCRDNGITTQIDISTGHGRITNSNNYNQDVLLKKLNDSGVLGYQVNAKNGICWAAATVSVFEALGASTSPYTKPTPDHMFCTTVKTAYDNHYISNATINYGLHSKYQSKLLTNLFPQYRLTNCSCKKDYKNQTEIYNKISECVDSGSVTLFTIPGHMMCGCGYDNFIAKYNITAGGRVITQNSYNYFVVVNDTWANNANRQYSYYPKDKIVNASNADVILDNIFCTTYIEKK